jgi:hypothetical protein
MRFPDFPKISQNHVRAHWQTRKDRHALLFNQFGEIDRPPMCADGRFDPFHGGNRGSNPLGDANENNMLCEMTARGVPVVSRLGVEFAPPVAALGAATCRGHAIAGAMPGSPIRRARKPPITLADGTVIAFPKLTNPRACLSHVQWRALSPVEKIERQLGLSLAQMCEIMSRPWDECDAAWDCHRGAGVVHLLGDRHQDDPRVGRWNARLRGCLQAAPGGHAACTEKIGPLGGVASTNWSAASTERRPEGGDGDLIPAPLEVLGAQDERRCGLPAGERLLESDGADCDEEGDGRKAGRLAHQVAANRQKAIGRRISPKAPPADRSHGHT